MAVTALLKKKISIVLVLLLALLLITLVIWFFNKKIEKIDKAYPVPVSYLHPRLTNLLRTNASY